MKIGSWLPDDETFGSTGRDWAVGCIRRWSFDDGENRLTVEEVILDGESFMGAALLCLLGLDPPVTPGPEDPPWVHELRTPVSVSPRPLDLESGH